MPDPKILPRLLFNPADYDSQYVDEDGKYVKASQAEKNHYKQPKESWGFYLRKKALKFDHARLYYGKLEYAKDATGDRAELKRVTDHIVDSSAQGKFFRTALLNGVMTGAMTLGVVVGFALVVIGSPLWAILGLLRAIHNPKKIKGIKKRVRGGIGDVMDFVLSVGMSIGVVVGGAIGLFIAVFPGLFTGYGELIYKDGSKHPSVERIGADGVQTFFADSTSLTDYKKGVSFENYGLSVDYSEAGTVGEAYYDDESIGRNPSLDKLVGRVVSPKCEELKQLTRDESQLASSVLRVLVPEAPQEEGGLDLPEILGNPDVDGQTKMFALYSVDAALNAKEKETPELLAQKVEKGTGCKRLPSAPSS